MSAIEQKAAIVDIPRLTPIELAGRVTGWWGPLYRQVSEPTTLAYPLCPCAASPCAVRMDQDEERQFIESVTLRIWKARAEGAIIGAAFVLGIGLLLFLVTNAGPLNPVSVFLYSAMLVMVYLLWQRVFRKP